MKSLIHIAWLGILLFSLSGLREAQAHCEIPCGIFDDHMRIHMIEEHITTIYKSMASIQALYREKDSAQTLNQTVRWIDLKEKQATKIQEIMSQYFLAQRITPGMGQAVYTNLLKKAHRLIVLAMKTKQTVNAGIIKDLRKTLKSFEKAYTKATKANKK